MAREKIHTLVASCNRGRYACDDPDTGHDLTSGEPVSLEVLSGVWIEGRIEHSSSYDGPGCYSIADSGRKNRASNATLTQEELQRHVSKSLQTGLSLADALASATGQTADVFCGYHFISKDGQIIGLCTGMRVKLYNPTTLRRVVERSAP